MLPGTRPTAFDMVATTGGYPKASRVGKVTRVPEPTTVLIVPAAIPARKMQIASKMLTHYRLSFSRDR